MALHWLGYSLCTFLGYGPCSLFSSLLPGSSLFLHANSHHCRSRDLSLCCIHTNFRHFLCQKCPTNCIPRPSWSLSFRLGIQVTFPFSTLQLNITIKVIFIGSIYIYKVNVFLVFIYFLHWRMEWTKRQEALQTRLCIILNGWNPGNFKCTHKVKHSSSFNRTFCLILI